jgi:hypothetical protein
MAKGAERMDDVLVREAKSLVDDADAEGLALRLVGSIGFRMLCEDHRSLHRDDLDREVGDIDLVGHKRDRDGIQTFFESRGYEVDKDILLSGWGDRLVMYGERDGHEYEVDIFLGQMDMCHELDVSDRLDAGPSAYALNPADLFLEKAQIVEINEKDLKDILTLFLEFPVAASDDRINSEYIADLLSRDWGFFFTVTNNMTKVREYLKSTDAIDDGERERVETRLDELETALDSAPKSVRWQLRSLLGTRWKWYTTVDEKHR